jgi:hypothetical protein
VQSTAHRIAEKKAPTVRLQRQSAPYLCDKIFGPRQRKEFSRKAPKCFHPEYGIKAVRKAATPKSGPIGESGWRPSVTDDDAVSQGNWIGTRNF